MSILSQFQDGASRAIVRQIIDLGYHVTLHRVNDTVELHAIKTRDGDDVQISRCNDGDGPEEEYRAACMLARAVGIELDDG